MSGSKRSAKSFRPEYENTRQIHLRINADLLARVDAAAEKRRLSRAVMFEGAVEEYLDKLDRIEANYKKAEGETDG